MSKKILPLRDIKHKRLKHPFGHEEEFSQAIIDNFLEYISEIIGEEIIPETVKKEEKAGGDYHADIIAEIDVSEDADGTRSKIIIENQYDKSDHKHLGQCVTYTANKDAKIIVWICEEFREAHLQAIEWLNEKFNGEIGFYGLEAVAYEGDSFADGIPRLHFDVKVEPKQEKIVKGVPSNRKRFELINMTQSKFNKISDVQVTKTYRAYWNAQWLPTDWKKDRIHLFWKHSTKRGDIMYCYAKCRTGTKKGKKMIDDVATWRILQDNMKMIKKRLPDVEEYTAKSKVKKRSLRIGVHIDEGIEKIDGKRMEQISDKLANDMNQLVEIVKELKL